MKYWQVEWTQPSGEVAVEFAWTEKEAMRIAEKHANGVYWEVK